jgi:ribosomal protein L11 methylase PrmA
MVDGRVFRTVTESGRDDYEAVRSTTALEPLVDRELLIAAREVERGILSGVDPPPAYVLEHPRLPFISHPYEWPFALLKDAAILTLRIHLEVLDHGVHLSDASAYNIQFRGCNPLYIDYLSFRPYHEGDFWYGHRQFCHQFLNPLLLTTFTGVPYNPHYRGALTGLPAGYLRPLLPWWRQLNWRTFAHVTLQAKLESRGAVDRESHEAIARRRLPQTALRNMLSGLLTWIERLEPGWRTASHWMGYAGQNNYQQAEQEAKRGFVADFAARTHPGILWDLGCNTGEYAELALDAGASYAVGFDTDHGALGLAAARAKARGLQLLPLYSDATNPSPDQGWAQGERSGLVQRAADVDALLALALIHHLVIANNIPLEETVRWLVMLAPTGVLEFVPKSDPMVKQMLTGRPDIFPDYTEDAFLHHVSARARIVRAEHITAAGRLLVWYER